MLPINEDSVVAPLRCSIRITRSNTCLSGYLDSQFWAYLVETADPTNNDIPFQQAILHPGWHAAMEEELLAIQQTRTWSLVSLPLGRQAIPCRWVFKRKPLSDTHARLKARLVARGDFQKQGIDFFETFAPIVKWSTLRTITAIAASLGWGIYHMDVDTAFMNSKVQEVIYMKQPPGFINPGQEDLVCLLHNSINGLRQSSKAWYHTLHLALCQLGWSRSKLDNNLYFIQEGSSLTVVLTHVDDFYVTGSSAAIVTAHKDALSSRSKMKDLGPTTKYLGIDFLSTSSGITIHQRGYCQEMLSEFSMATCFLLQLLFLLGKLSLLILLIPPVNSVLYCRMVGKLIYLTNTRPDISYVVGLVSGFMQEPREDHLQVTKHILCYIKHTLHFGIFYPRRAHLELTTYTDADWASCTTTTRSVGAYLILLGGSPVS